MHSSIINYITVPVPVSYAIMKRIMMRRFVFVVVSLAVLCSSVTTTATTTATMTRLSPDDNVEATSSLLRASVSATATVAPEEGTVVAAAAVTADYDGTTTIILNDNNNDAVRFLGVDGNNNNNNNSNEVLCEDQENCKECFDASPDCSWTKVSYHSGYSEEGCSNEPCQNNKMEDDTRNIPPSLTACGNGVNARKRKKLKEWRWKKTHRNRCKRLPRTCRDQSRAGDCVNCLSGRNKDEGCFWIPTVNACYNSCSITDVGCYTGSLPKKGAKNVCKAIQKDQKNSELCRSKSDSNCNECTSTKIMRLNKEDGKKEEALCKWFPTDNGDFCDNEWNFQYGGNGESTCTIENVVDNNEKDGIFDEENRHACKVNGFNCTTCVSTSLQLVVGLYTTDDAPTTCQWYPTNNITVVNGGGGGGICLHKCKENEEKDNNSSIDCRNIDPVQTCDVDDDDDDDDDGSLDEHNSELCKSKSHLNCNECIRTNLKLPNRLSTTIAPTCQWYPVAPDVFTIGGSGGFCLHKCEKNNEEENNSIMDCSNTKPVQTCDGDGDDDDDDDDGSLDEQNSELCKSKSHLNCNECIRTNLKLADGMYPIIAPTCQWYPVPPGVITIGASGGNCLHKCEKNDEEENNSIMDCSNTKPVQTCDGDGDGDDDDDDDGSLDEQNSKLCKSKSHLNCEECIRTNLLYNYNEPQTKAKTILPTCKWFPATNNITIGSSGGSCGSKCKKNYFDYDCGVTMMCPTPIVFPPVGTPFPEYGPPLNNGKYNGNEVKGMLLDLYPGLNVEIIKDGTDVTEDIRDDRVRIFVSKSNGEDKDGDLGERSVVKIPRVG